VPLAVTCSRWYSQAGRHGPGQSDDRRTARAAHPHRPTARFDFARRSSPGWRQVCVRAGGTSSGSLSHGRTLRLTSRARRRPHVWRPRRSLLTMRRRAGQPLDARPPGSARLSPSASARRPGRAHRRRTRRHPSARNRCRVRGLGQLVAQGDQVAQRDVPGVRPRPDQDAGAPTPTDRQTCLDARPARLKRLWGNAGAG
jgi:hypothetical protein